MATPIQMPALSPTMTEGKITKWLKKEGDKVAAGEAIAECETDKSNLEIEVYEDGVLLKILVKEGESAAVGAAIGYVGAKGDSLAAPAPAPAPAPAKAAATAPVPPSPAKVAVEVPAAPPAAAPENGGGKVVPLRREETAPDQGRLRASPLARKIALDRGVSLAQVQGSGPQGRIVKRDVEAALSRAPAKATAPAARTGPRREPRNVPLSTMRKVIAQRLQEVKPGVPHFYLTVEVEMDAAMGIREEAKALDSKVSVNDIIVKATAMALHRAPQINVSLQGDRIVQYDTADVGIAVAIDEGLITPIIRDADQKGLAQISAESRELAERARKRTLRPEEYAGGSITVSNLGMFGIDSFTAVINPPQAAIVAVGAVADRPVARNGQLVIRKMMTVTLSGDHRVIDGALGAAYLKELKGLLEHPLRLLF